MIEETVKEIRVNLPQAKKVGLLCTTGTIKTKLYQELFGKIKVDVISPDVTEQRSIMNAIYGREGIKAGYLSGKPKGDIIKVAKGLIRRGAKAIIIGCTEISMVIKEKDVTVPIIDSLDILVKVAVNSLMNTYAYTSLLGELVFLAPVFLQFLSIQK
jgi:aspartate racemase